MAKEAIPSVMTEPTPQPTRLPTPTVATAPTTGSEVSPGLPEATPTPPVDGSQCQGGGDCQEPGAEADATPAPDTTPETPQTPTQAPTPTPPQFRPVQPPPLIDLPGGSGGAPIFKFSSGPRIQHYQVSLSGTIASRPDLAAQTWTVQVWQSQFPVDLTASCSTEKPVAFIMAPSGSGHAFIPIATPYTWTYCVQDQRMTRSIDVPWLRATSWGLTERGRRRTTEPRIWDFSMSANLDDDRVAALEYARPQGWTILVWAGDTLVAREWVGF